MTDDLRVGLRQVEVFFGVAGVGIIWPCAVQSVQQLHNYIFDTEDKYLFFTLFFVYSIHLLTSWFV